MCCAEARLRGGVSPRAHFGSIHRGPTLSPPPGAPFRGTVPDRPACMSLSTQQHWAFLPGDVLVEAFKYIPVRPRLLVIGVVCRRWRRAAIASIDALPEELAPQLTGAASALLSGLREVHILGPANEDAAAAIRCLNPQLCERLRAASITIRGDCAAHLAHLAAYCTKLERLSVASSLTIDAAEALSQVLHRSFTSLTSLTLHTAAPWQHRRDHPALPRLRSLHFVSPRPTMEEAFGIICCIQAHSSALTSLSLAVDHLDTLSAISLPCLGSLTAKASFVRDESVAWLESLPSLTALNLDRSWNIFDDQEAGYIARLAPKLVSLLIVKSSSGYGRPGETIAACNLLARCTKLASLELINSDASVLPLWITLGSRLTELSLSVDLCNKMPEHGWSRLLTGCTALTSLSVADGVPLSVLSEWHLPHLRCIRTYTQSYAFIVAMLRLFPQLEELRIGALRAPESADFFPALQAAGRDGLRVVCLRYGHTYLTQHAAEVRALRWVHLGMEPAPRDKSYY